MIRFTLDGEHLSQIKNTKIRPSEFNQLDDGLVAFNSTFFVEYEDTTAQKVNDIVIIPVELDVVVELNFTASNNSHEFPIPQLQFKDFRIFVHNCEWALNKRYVKSSIELANEEEYGDFADDDEEEAEMSGVRKFVKSSTQQLLCSMVHLANNA